MKKIEVCLSPELIHLYDLKDKIVVVVDIFRATTTMVTAFANDVKSILPLSSLEECRAMSDHGYIIAGERNGQTAEGFELGNSPLSYLNGAYSEKKIAMTTTNGTLTIEKSRKGSSEILVGAFINLKSTVHYLQTQGNDILIHCAGWKGKFNLEDSLYAGALVDGLSESHDYDCDSAIATRSLYLQNKHDLTAFLQQASHAKRLQNHNIEADIDFCLTMDIYNIVVKVVDGELVKNK
ncbi:2-phosphosulfolactate phosphatase [Anditalea andensis]|uniref:Probable 2-phosphosulfolactate phosphatase n=1 Tax=Anditalea andensis TaxID=1048983 RepID=A0A074KXW3_9BACT|nr:2-phosphosulfolactate phosphatase [Anditalea andensis]KEO74816.1 2-phosphosulfolactate phosphatase [Anditalea andensis]